ncbi:MAG: DUF3422 domain-containing protein [Rhodospirillales bacterium]|nr:DUF3422 domain-containing protein [Rhodospirillales bacterium]
MDAQPNKHPLRGQLNYELHARPFETMQSPERVSHIALLSGEARGDTDRESLVKLCEHFNAALPPTDAKNYIVDLSGAERTRLRVRWERHTEFCTYTFFKQGKFGTPFQDPVINLLPASWMEGLKGELFAAVHLVLEPKDKDKRRPEELPLLFEGNSIVGCHVAGGRAIAYSDLKLHDDGFGRILVRDQGLSARQAGRLVQRLLEIETYRNLALAALPLARDSSPRINAAERKLAQVAQRMSNPGDEESDADLLQSLSNLAANVEEIVASSSYRYRAAHAYYQIVIRRLNELRQERIEGLQTFSEFLDRRLAPAMATCEATEQRQEALSKRASRVTSLLRARVDVELEEQNRSVLESMNRRAKLQLRLQETVEGLSVVAISYYLVGLVGYAINGLKSAGLPLDKDIATAISVPVVLLAVWLGLKRMKKSLHADEE